MIKHIQQVYIINHYNFVLLVIRGASKKYNFSFTYWNRWMTK